MSKTDFENSFLAKRHSFPHNFTESSSSYTWNLVRTPKQNCGGTSEDPAIEDDCPAPVINSEGSHEEREARLEAAILWIRKQLSDMRNQDKHLTRQFIQLRAAIQRVKSENRLLTDIDGGLGNARDDGLTDLSFRHSISGPIVRSKHHFSVL